MAQTKGSIKPEWDSVSINLKEITYIRDAIERKEEVTSRGFGPNLPNGYYRKQKRFINKAYKNKTLGQHKNFEIFADDLRKINLAEKSFRNGGDLDKVVVHTQLVTSDEGLDHTFIQKVYCKIKGRLKESGLWND